MKQWDPKNEWKSLVKETNIRASKERINEFFGRKKKKSTDNDESSSDDSSVQQGTTETRKVKTWGELGEMLAVAINAKEIAKKSKGTEAMAKAAKQLIGLTPAGWLKDAIGLAGSLKDLHAVYKMAGDLDDEKAEKAPIMKAFNIDDGYAEILDDRLETEFLRFMTKYVQDKIKSDGDSNIPADLDVNTLLEKFLKKRGNYDETVTDAGSMAKFTDIDYPKDGQKFKDAVKGYGKAFYDGIA